MLCFASLEAVLGQKQHERKAVAILGIIGMGCPKVMSG